MELPSEAPAQGYEVPGTLEQTERLATSVTPEFMGAAAGLADAIEAILPDQTRKVRETLSTALIEFYKQRGA